MRRASLILGACLLSTIVGAAQFKRLSSVEIKRTLAQRIITDDAHWSDRFDANGNLHSMELGQARTGIWRVNGNELCTVRNTKKAEEECFEVWVDNDEIELRRDGIAVISAFLRSRPQ